MESFKYILSLMGKAGLEISLILLLTFGIHYGLKKIWSFIERSKQSFWRNLFIDAAKKPLRNGIWLFAFAAIADIILSNFVTGYAYMGKIIQKLIIIFMTSWFAMRVIEKSEDEIFKRKNLLQEWDIDKTALGALAKLARVLVIMIMILMFLDILGLDLTGIITFAGIGGIGFSFAAKDLLANFFGTITIYLDKPFAVGDWIRSSEKNIEGNVEEISWRLTKIRKLDRSLLYVPNSIFTNLIIENPSRMLNRRIFEKIAIRYEDINVVDNITKEIIVMLKNHDSVDQAQLINSSIVDYCVYAVEIMVYCYVKELDFVPFHQVKHDILLKTTEIIHKNNAAIAFYQSSRPANAT